MRRTFDTAALAAAFPFTSPDLPPPDPTRVAAPAACSTATTSAARAWSTGTASPWTTTTPSILGRSGAGKSYLVKLELLRSLYRGHRELTSSTPKTNTPASPRAVGGTYVHLGAEDVRLNPFDLPIHTRPDGRRTAPKDALVRRALFLHTVIGVLLGSQLAPAETGRAGPGDRRHLPAGRHHRGPAHLDPPGPAAGRPGRRLARLEGPDRDGPGRPAAPVRPAARSPACSTGRPPPGPTGHLVVFSLRDLPDELKPHRHSADPGRGLAARVQPGDSPTAAGDRGRGMAADAATRRRTVPVPDGQGRPASTGPG